MFGLGKNKKNTQTPQSGVSNIPLDESKIHTMHEDLNGPRILKQEEATQSGVSPFATSGSSDANSPSKASPLMQVAQEAATSVDNTQGLEIKEHQNIKKGAPLQQKDLTQEFQSSRTMAPSALGDLGQDQKQTPQTPQTPQAPQEPVIPAPSGPPLSNTPQDRSVPPSLPKAPAATVPAAPVKQIKQISRDELHSQLDKLDKEDLSIGNELITEGSNIPMGGGLGRKDASSQTKISPNMPAKDFSIKNNVSKSAVDYNASMPQYNKKEAKILSAESAGGQSNEQIKTTPSQKNEVASSGSKKERDISSMVFYVVVPLVVLALLGGGGYYYWISRNAEPVPIVVIEPEDPEPIELPEDPVEKYDTMNPNSIHLSENEMLLDKLQNIANDVAVYDVGTMIEFYFVQDPEGLDVVSSKKIWESLEINLGQELVELLADVHSIYMYRSQEGVRLGVVIDVIDRDAAQDWVSKHEDRFFRNPGSLFFDFEPGLVEGEFSDGAHRSYTIRYKNIDENESASIDYTFRRSSLMIGTSKDTLRMILDAADGQMEEQPGSEMMMENEEGSEIGDVSI